MLFYFSLFSYPAKYITMGKKNGSADPEKKGPVKMSKLRSSLVLPLLLPLLLE